MMKMVYFRVLGKNDTVHAKVTLRDRDISCPRSRRVAGTSLRERDRPSAIAKVKGLTLRERGQGFAIAKVWSVTPSRTRHLLANAKSTVPVTKLQQLAHTPQTSENDPRDSFGIP